MTAQWRFEDAAATLHPPTDSDDKYTRGVLGIRTGSDEYPGAAVLGVEAAWRTGIGMVRYVGAHRPSHLVLQRRPETVLGGGRVQAWLIGSGTDAAGRSAHESAALRRILADHAPAVIDAGALDLAPEATAPAVVTPHAREHDRLRAALGLDVGAPGEADRASAALETARALGGAVLLKGSITIVATPGGWTRAVTAPTPWLATAGTGDVLGGILGALVASAAARGPVDAEALGPLAATAALLHGHAGLIAAREAARSGGNDAHATGPVTALDVAEALPAAVAHVLAHDVHSDEP